MTTVAEILRALRANETGISGAELCKRLGVSRTAIWSHIESLRNVGFEIIASPHRGYQLTASPEALLADDLCARLSSTRIIGSQIRVLPQTTSTNDEATQASRAGAEDGLVVFAESQTAGRGRLGRAWHSAAGKGLWFSVLLRPSFAPSDCTRLTVTAATALARAIRATTGLTTQIKWPNDLLIDGRKIAGILMELSAEVDHIHHVVIGIGMDVNQTVSEFPSAIKGIATSLKIAGGKTVNRAELAVAVMQELDADYHRVQSGRFKDVADEWAAQCDTLGREVNIQIGAHRHTGRAEALDESGALLLRTPHGRIERITGGDVTLAQ